MSRTKENAQNPQNYTWGNSRRAALLKAQDFAHFQNWSTDARNILNERASLSEKLLFNKLFPNLSP